jgi:hypothetical protein
MVELRVRELDAITESFLDPCIVKRDLVDVSGRRDAFVCNGFAQKS